ncbi:HlyD family efflux transporter periplasmic adaptor subunit [Pedobacter sp. SG908]|uniref:HlyD family secretion protein n=1 Tax=Pedobacter sp. SG908 TaxID=2587135 RepID=UPI00141E6F14|nr:HlyD family efflux transporter periplasmic adaptor subunit [Pedobacter sp. SG908]NII83148.1 HlyD family secretion protein [Pedobacter sp. SG908]
MLKSRNYEEHLHSEDIQEIIAKPPSWLLKRGIGLIFLTIILVLSLSTVIKYPNKVSAVLKINAINGPKMVSNRQAGKITKILVTENQSVSQDDDLAYIESTADPKQVIRLLKSLNALRQTEQSKRIDLYHLTAPNYLQLGELQASYQTFYQAFINFTGSVANGINLKKRNFLLKEIENLKNQGIKIKQNYELQKKELVIAQNQYQKYRTLSEKKVISQMEMDQQEALFLSKQQPINMTENSILNNNATISAREKEISEIDNQMREEQMKFAQSLNSLISDIESWKKLHVISSPTDGKIVFATSIQENQYVDNGRELFYINPGNESYFGEMNISQINMAKIKSGQKVQVRLRSYPSQEFGFIDGVITSMSAIPIKDSIFLSQVKLFRNPKDSLIHLKPGMIADAEIITEDQSVLKRILLNVTKSLNMR